MNEIKRRIAIIDEAMVPMRQSGAAAVPNIELSCLQLRKVFELIAFATLSANRHKYVELRAKYEKDWDIGEITRLISKFNPKFLPIPISETNPTDGTMGEIFDHEDRAISRKELVTRHGKLGEILHAQNPYKPFPDYRAWSNLVIEWRNEVVALLSNHKAWVDHEQTFYRVAMNTTPTGEVQVAVMELVNS